MEKEEDMELEKIDASAVRKNTIVLLKDRPCKVCCVAANSRRL